MSSNQVFDQLLTHYQATGKIMQREQFAEIAKKYPKKTVVDGVLKFDRYLDECRTYQEIRQEVSSNG